MLQQRWAFSAQWLAAATMGPNIFFRILVSNRKRNNTRLHKQSEPKQAEWQQKLDFDCVCVCVSYAGFFSYIYFFIFCFLGFIYRSEFYTQQTKWLEIKIDQAKSRCARYLISSASSSPAPSKNICRLGDWRNRLDHN